MRWHSSKLFQYFIVSLIFSAAAAAKEVELDLADVPNQAYPVSVSLLREDGSTAEEKIIESKEIGMTVSLEPDQKYLWSAKFHKTKRQQSGMIITVGPKSEKNRFLEVKWPAQLKDSKFYLRLINLGDLRSSVYLSADDRVFIERSDDFGLIYIKIQRYNKTVPIDLEMFNSLQLVTGIDLEKIPEIITKQSETAPITKKGELSSKSKVRNDIIIDTFNNPPPVLKRRPYIQVNGKMARENFRIIRDEDFDSPSTVVMGGGVEAFYQSNSGIYSHFLFDSHGTETNYNSETANPPGKQQKRYEAAFSLGADVLNIDTRNEDHFLGIGLSYFQRQLPLDHDNQTLRSFGAQFSYIFFMDDFEWRLRIGIDQKGSQSFLLGTSYIYSKHFGLDLGLYSKRTLAVGQLRSNVRGDDYNARFLESGISGGLRYIF